MPCWPNSTSRLLSYNLIAKNGFCCCLSVFTLLKACGGKKWQNMCSLQSLEYFQFAGTGTRRCDCERRRGATPRGRQFQRAPQKSDWEEKTKSFGCSHGVPTRAACSVYGPESVMPRLPTKGRSIMTWCRRACCTLFLLITSWEPKSLLEINEIRDRISRKTLFIPSFLVMLC